MRFCWMCDRIRPNEAFSGRNHGRHLCRGCVRLPRGERDRRQRLKNLWEMLARQSNISKTNIDTAAAWTSDTNAEVAMLATLVVEIGHVHPRRRKRHGNIRRNHPELFRRMVAAGVAFEGPDATDAWEPAGDAMPEEDDPFTGASVDDDFPF